MVTILASARSRTLSAGHSERCTRKLLARRAYWHTEANGRQRDSEDRSSQQRRNNPICRLKIISQRHGRPCFGYESLFGELEGLCLSTRLAFRDDAVVDGSS